LISAKKKLKSLFKHLLSVLKTKESMLKKFLQVAKKLKQN